MALLFLKKNFRIRKPEQKGKIKPSAAASDFL